MALEPFDFHLLPRLIFGRGAVDRLGELAEELGGRRVLVVSDPGVIRAGHTTRGIESLRAHGLEAFLFAEVEENPTTRHVGAGVDFARAHDVDFLVGLGGGSVLDCAKGVNFIYSSGGEMRDYWGYGKATRPLLPMIAVPTTAGTGSESQSFAIIADERTHQKMACGDKKAACRAAILDPELTTSQPRRVTAATGIDALAHAVESFVTRKRNPMSRLFSREAWRLLEANLERVLREPEDVEARGAMQLGATLAGTAVELSMLGAAHAAANPLTAHYGVVHGAAVGMLLPHVVRFNAEAEGGSAGSDYAELVAQASGCGGEASSTALAHRLDALLEASGLPTHLSSWNVKRRGLEILAEEASRQWTAQFNPRPLNAPQVLELYERAF